MVTNFDVSANLEERRKAGPEGARAMSLTLVAIRLVGIMRTATMFSDLVGPSRAN